MAITYVAGNRAVGTNAERLALYIYPDGLGSSANATAYNGVTQNATGKLGSYAWSFDGSNDYVGSISSDLGNTWTISFWVKGQSSGQGSGYWAGMVGKGSTDNNEEIRVSAYSTFWDTEWSSTNWNNDLSTTLDDGNWHHIVIIFQSGGTSYQYLDNVQKNSGSITAASTRTNQLTLGKDWYGSQFRGSMDEFSYWNRALSSTEIGYLYNSGTGRTIPDAVTTNGLSTIGLKVYYNFEQTSGSLTNQAITSTNIQNGLEFHETDTNTDYVWNSSNNTWYQIT